MRWRILSLKLAVIIIISLFIVPGGVYASDTWSYVINQSVYYNEMSNSGSNKVFVISDRNTSHHLEYSSNIKLGSESVLQFFPLRSGTTPLVEMRTTSQKIFLGWRHSTGGTYIVRYSNDPVGLPVVENTYYTNEVGRNRFTDFDVYGTQFFSYLSQGGDIYNNLVISKDSGASWTNINFPYLDMTAVDIFDGDPNVQGIVNYTQKQLFLTLNCWASSFVVNVNIFPRDIRILGVSPLRYAITDGTGIDIYENTAIVNSITIPGAIMDWEIIGGLLYYTTSQREIGFVDSGYNKTIIPITGIPDPLVPDSIGRITFDGGSAILVGVRSPGTFTGGLYVNKNYYAGVPFTLDSYKPPTTIIEDLDDLIEQFQIIIDALSDIFAFISTVFYLIPALLESLLLSVVVMGKIVITLIENIYIIYYNIISANATASLSIPITLLGSTSMVLVDLTRWASLKTIINIYLTFLVLYKGFQLLNRIDPE